MVLAVDFEDLDGLVGGAGLCIDVLIRFAGQLVRRGIVHTARRLP